MDENDMHIFEAIRVSGARQIFVSVFGDENSDANRRLKANARAYLSSAGKHIDFFDASTALVWV